RLTASFGAPANRRCHGRGQGERVTVAWLADPGCGKTGASMSEYVIADVLIPGRGEPIERGVVVFEDGGSISLAGPAGGAPARSDDDRFTEVPVVLPGLWDCHSHFWGQDLLDLERLTGRDPLAGAARAVSDVAAVLDGGVTSVRDTGGMGLSLAAVVD